MMPIRPAAVVVPSTKPAPIRAALLIDTALPSIMKSSPAPFRLIGPGEPKSIVTSAPAGGGAPGAATVGVVVPTKSMPPILLVLTASPLPALVAEIES